MIDLNSTSRVVLFGAGINGISILSKLIKQDIVPAYYVDNNTKITHVKWGDDIEERCFPVRPPEVLLKEDKTILKILITPDEPWYDEIYSQIINMGLVSCLIDYNFLSINRLYPRGKFEKIGYELYQEYPDYKNKYTSFTSKYQISFLIGLINSFKFRNTRKIQSVLEIGVNNGVTSLYMLKEGCKEKGFTLYGIDKGEGEFYSQAVYREATDEELTHYHFFGDTTSFDIEKVLSGKVDMVFIDAGHTHPHPIIDLIHVIPYLHNESIIVLHDVVNYMQPNAWGESFIYCGWDEEKLQSVIINEANGSYADSGMGIIKLPDNKKQLYDNIERIVQIPFRAAPWKFDEFYIGINENNLLKLRSFMHKNYDIDFAEKICDKLLSNLKDYMNHWLLLLHETRFFNYLYEQSRKHEQTIRDMQDKIEKLSHSKD